MIPRILTLTAVLLACAELSGCYNYHALVPLHDIPAGTVIKDSDFSTERCGTLFRPMIDLAEDRSRVVGHKALKPLHGGTRFHYSDVSR
ncbi:MAG: SAF domain-containing protein [Candidatus Sulfotelmatobacter sp.]